jgi:uncharacterized protein YggT (Ycf19 family)
MGIGRFVATFLNLYATVIFVYVVMGWFAGGLRGPVREIHNALAVVSEPYLALFRRILPPMMIGSGGIDFSPLIGLFALQILANFVTRLTV